MNEKKCFEEPTLTVMVFDVEDIITTSAGGGGIELPDHNWD